MAALNPFAEALLLQAIPTIEKTRYAELASTVIILFDHVITLDQEHSTWSLGKVLFLMNRYYALCIVICLSWFRWQGWTGVITFIIAEFILQLRLYALYFRDKRVLACMLTVCLGAAASSAYVMGDALAHITSVAVTLPSGSTVCVPTGLPAHFYAFWIPMLVSESALCGLALFRGFQSYSPGSTVFQSGKRIIEILVRDSLFYFVIIFATYLTNTIIFFTRPDSEVEISIGFAVALSVVMANRLCLNVRGYIRAENASLSTLPAPYAARSHHHSRSHAHPGAQGYSGCTSDGEDGEGEGAYGEEESRDERERGWGMTTIKVVHGGVLSEVEMRELRAMRAQSPKHTRTL
ncbi:hypothetical protein OH77DRAFT_1392695 [Trametes cingulata]|nr:hypothetical protein OH77DRAFT_1392695 [Trametes cingulata]